MSTRLRLPIGIQTLAKIREGGCYYVDKTPFIAQLFKEGSYYFLSRPRRFGKSLFLDTLAEAFAGNRSLFTGLYLEDHWDWDKRHPVVRLSFAEGGLGTRAELDRRIRKGLEENAIRLGVCLDDLEDIPGSFGQLITRAAERHGQRAVVLVDECDKPILDNLTEPEIARQMREGLRDLYSVIKGRRVDLCLVFLTGVSKCSRVSLFSGLNDLKDITLDERYTAICGYTEGDLDQVFAPEFIAAAESGQPLSRETLRHCVFAPGLESTLADEERLSAFDLEHIEPEAMLWQMGHLTIQETTLTPSGPVYRLGLPNHEVRTALNAALLHAWIPEESAVWRQGPQLYAVLAAGDAAALCEHFRRLFASIPQAWYDKYPIARDEGHAAGLFYSRLVSLGLSVSLEEVVPPGLCDLAVRYGQVVWIFGFKVIEGSKPTGEALAQLRAKNYAAKYRAPHIKVLEIGVEFSKTKRQIVGWELG